MNREHRLSYCERCSNQELDLRRGIICSLTNERAAFDLECPDFIENNTKITTPEEEIQKERDNDGLITRKMILGFLFIIMIIKTLVEVISAGSVSTRVAIKIILIIAFILLKLIQFLIKLIRLLR